jgi:hypothetical protein
LLLALIFGLAAAASPAAAPKAADLAAIKSSHLIHLKSIKQVRLAGIGVTIGNLTAAGIMRLPAIRGPHQNPGAAVPPIRVQPIPGRPMPNASSTCRLPDGQVFNCTSGPKLSFTQIHFRMWFRYAWAKFWNFSKKIDPSCCSEFRAANACFKHKPFILRSRMEIMTVLNKTQAAGNLIGPCPNCVITTGGIPTIGTWHPPLLPIPPLNPTQQP